MRRLLRHERLLELPTRQTNPSRLQRLAQMIRTTEVEYGVTEIDQQLFVLARELAGQRMVLRFHEHAIPEPLPELGLRCPKLSATTAYNQRGSFLLPLRSFFILFAQGGSRFRSLCLYTLRP